MRRNAARIGLVGVLALSMGVATATAPPARADDPTSLIAPARSSAGLMNYAINLSPGAAPADLERALAMVSSAGGVALASYPQIGTFFAQSESASFAPDMAEALAGRSGLWRLSELVSIGWELPSRMCSRCQGQEESW